VEQSGVRVVMNCVSWYEGDELAREWLGNAGEAEGEEPGGEDEDEEEDAEEGICNERER
jgi:hypothetical protein